MTGDERWGGDPHVLLFGPDPELDQLPEDEFAGYSRRDSRHANRRRRSRNRALSVMVLALVVVLAGAGWFVARPFISDRLHPADYTGSGTGTAFVSVQQGDGAGAIGDSLLAAGVVASTRAFTDAATADNRAQSLQPGRYQMRRHMSAKAALSLMLDPASRIVHKVVIPEGQTILEVEAKLATALSVPLDSVKAAVRDVNALGLPVSYTTNGGPPTSAEGFLFPDTYDFDPGLSVSDALQKMTDQFTSEDKQLGFAQAAAKVKLTPYQALIVASMIEGEAKFDADRAKVARVVLNRLAAKMPLGIDATSLYGAELAGRPASSVTFTESSPYNTRNRIGLPPTPIDNPGAAALTAAVAPAVGNWLYYVNGDAAGHLYFTASAADFDTAVARCKDQHWGCT